MSLIEIETDLKELKELIIKMKQSDNHKDFFKYQSLLYKKVSK